MIDYVKRNDIFGDFRRNLSNSEIARKRGISRTTVVGFRKLYNATVNDKDNPEAYAELLQTEPKYKDREVDCPVLTDEIKSLIDQELINNATKVAMGMKKQQKRATDIHADLCRAGYNVLYASVPRLLVKIRETESQRKLSRLQKRFEKYDLTILDECGYKSFDKEGAEALFNLISLRAGIKSIIITTNLGFDKWDQIFTDKVIAAAIVDRLTFKAYIIDMNGPSYRIKATEKWMNERKMKQKPEK